MFKRGTGLCHRLRKFRPGVVRLGNPPNLCAARTTFYYFRRSQPNHAVRNQFARWCSDTLLSNAECVVGTDVVFWGFYKTLKLWQKQKQMEQVPHRKHDFASLALGVGSGGGEKTQRRCREGAHLPRGSCREVHVLEGLPSRDTSPAGYHPCRE